MTGANEWRNADSTADQHTFDYDFDGDEELGTAVTTAVASVTDSPVEDVSGSLTESVDPDGLDRMFRSDGDQPPATVRVHLIVNGCFVTIAGTGRITVEP